MNTYLHTRNNSGPASKLVKLTIHSLDSATGKTLEIDTRRGAHYCVVDENGLARNTEKAVRSGNNLVVTLQGGLEVVLKNFFASGKAASNSADNHLSEDGASLWLHFQGGQLIGTIEGRADNVLADTGMDGTDPLDSAARNTLFNTLFSSQDNTDAFTSNPVQLADASEQGALQYLHSDGTTLHALGMDIPVQEVAIGALAVLAFASAVNHSHSSASATAPAPVTPVPVAPVPVAPSPDTVVQIQGIGLGPITGNARLNVTIYQADGTTLLGTGTLDGNASPISITLSNKNYSGVALVRITGTAQYSDEASATTKAFDSNTSGPLLATLQISAGSVSSIYVNPLTTLTAIEAGVHADGSLVTGSSLRASDVANASSKVAQLFGLDNGNKLTAVAPDYSSDGFASGSAFASDGNRIGTALALVSGLEQARGISTQAAIQLLSDSFNTSSSGTPDYSHIAPLLVEAANTLPNSLGSNIAAAVNDHVHDTLHVLTLDISSDKPTLKAGDTARITFHFNADPGSSFSAADITLSGGTLGALSGSGNSRSAVFTPANNVNAGNASISVEAGSYSDAAGSSSGTGAALHLGYDTQPPTLAISSNKSVLKAGESAILNFSFSEDPAASFTTRNISTTGGTLGDLSPRLGNGSAQDPYRYTAVFTPSADSNNGSASISVAAGAFSDAAGNPGSAASAPAIHFDTARPTLTIQSDKESVNTGETATLRFRFSEDPGSSFTAASIQSSSGSVGSLSAKLGSGTAQDPYYYSASFSLSANSSNATQANISVLANSFTDLAGNTNPDKVSTQIDIHTRPPQLLNASAQDSSLTLQFDTALDAAAFASATSVAAANALFSFKTAAAGSSSFTPLANPFSAVSVSGNTLSLTLATALAAGQSARLSYTAPSGDPSVDVLQSQTGNDLASFADQAVSTAPVISSIAISDSDNSNGPNVGKAGEAVSVAVRFNQPVTLSANQTYRVHVQVEAGNSDNNSNGFDASFTAPATPVSGNSYTFSGTLPGNLALTGNALQLTQLSVPAGAAIRNSGNQPLSLNQYTLADSNAYRVDTAAPAQPLLALAAGVGDSANLTEATATSGVVSVLAEAGSTVTVTFVDHSGHNLQKILSGTGSSQGVALTASDLGSSAANQLSDGNIQVSAIVTDAAGNTSSMGVTQFTLDTALPASPVLTLGNSSRVATLEQATATSGVLSVQAEANTSVVLRFDSTDASGSHSLSKTLVGNGSTAIPVVLTSADLQTLHATSVVRVEDQAATPSVLRWSKDGINGSASLPYGGTSWSYSYDTNSQSISDADFIAQSGLAGVPAVKAYLLTFGYATADTVFTLSPGSAALAHTSAANPVITISASTSNAAGNSSSSSTSFTLDYLAPTAAIVSGSLAFSADSGTYATDFITNSASQTIHASLSSPPAAGETLLGSLDNGASWNNLNSFLSGTTLDWSNQSLGQGINVLQLKLQDAAGNTGAVYRQTYQFSTAHPAAATLALSEGISDGATLAEATSDTGVLLVSAQAGSVVQVTFTDSNSHTLVQTLHASGDDAAVRLNPADLGSGLQQLHDGTISVLAVVTDAAGNVNSSNSTTSFTLDTVAPTLDLNGSAAGVDSSTTISAANATSFSANSAILPAVATVSDSDVTRIVIDFAEGNNAPRTGDQLLVGSIAGAAEHFDLGAGDHSSSNLSLGDLSGLNYSYTASTHALSLFTDNGNALSAANIATALGTLQCMNASATAGTRDFAVHLIDKAGNDAVAFGHVVI